MPLDLVWREDDDSPVLRTFLDGGYAGAGAGAGERTVNDGISACSSGPIENA